MFVAFAEVRDVISNLNRCKFICNFGKKNILPVEIVIEIIKNHHMNYCNVVIKHRGIPVFSDGRPR